MALHPHRVERVAPQVDHTLGAEGCAGASAGHAVHGSPAGISNEGTGARTPLVALTRQSTRSLGIPYGAPPNPVEVPPTPLSGRYVDRGAVHVGHWWQVLCRLGGGGEVPARNRRAEREHGVDDHGDRGDRSRPSIARPRAFVGRSAELRTVVEAVEARPAVVLVAGEAGIGKSRLLAEAGTVLSSDGVRVLTGGCHPLREPLPYGPVIDALREISPWLPRADRLEPSAGVLAPLLPDLARRLPEPPPEGAGPGGQRHRLAAGVRTLLEAVAPVALLVEDLHWADDATRELLLLLARDVPRDTALVFTYRAEELPRGRPVLGVPYRPPPGTAGAELTLEPLDEAALRELARDGLGREPSATLVSTLLERSAGLPLIIEEDLVALGGTSDATALRVPRSLHEVMTQRTSTLSPDGLALAGTAAVLARPADEELLCRAAGLDDTRGRDALLETLEASVLRQRGPDTYGFAHSLAQEAVYEVLPGPVRNRYHRRVLVVLQAQDPPPLVQIAHHTRALGDQHAWLSQAQAAADQAMEVGDDGTAATLLRDIIRFPGLTSEQLGKAALAFATVTRNGVEHAETVATLRRIVLLPGLPVVVRGKVRSYLGGMLTNQAHAQVAGEEELLTALSEVGDADPGTAARVLASLGASESGRFSSAEQRAMVERGRALAAASGESEARDALEVSYYILLAIQGDPSLPGLLAALPREGSERINQRAVVMILANSAEGALCLGQDDRAAALIAEVLALAPKAHIPFLTAYARSYQILLDWQAGRWQEWESGLAEWRARYPETPLWDYGLVATAHGLTAAARGRAAEAEAEFDRALAQDGVSVLTQGAAAGAARIRLARHAPETAWASLREPLDHLAFLRGRELWTYAWDLVPTAVEILLALGEQQQAQDLADEHAAGIEGRDAPGAVAEQYLCSGLLSRAEDPDGALAAFDSAADLWRTIGRPYRSALAAEHAARTRADPADAAARLAEPIAEFDRLGATSDTARCHHHLRALGQDRPAPLSMPGRAGYGERLSPREEQVRDLLVRGASNKDIAVALFLSPRTVEHHVARTLRKLGTTRAELTRWGPG
ncbi:AAA family ATPase [Streptomyces wedmorensis]|uniref:ATP-binding protein n=1 Tax=Streptomyces wedmorensis TaxID=43759 RepID=UPI003442E83F